MSPDDTNARGLSTYLSKRMEGQPAAQEKIGRAQGISQQKSFEVFLPGKGAAVPSPNGQVLASLRFDKDRIMAELINLDAHVMVPTVLPAARANRDQPARPFWNSDGSKLLYFNGAELVAHDVNGTTVDPVPQRLSDQRFLAKLVGKGPKIRWAMAAAGPDQMIVQKYDVDGLFLYDLAAKKVSPIPGTGGIDGMVRGQSAWGEWAYVPNSGTLVSVAPGGDADMNLKTAKIDGNGKLSPWSLVKHWDKQRLRSNGVSFLNRGQGVTASDHYVVIQRTGERSQVVSVRNGEEWHLDDVLPPGWKMGKPWSTLHPDGRRLVIIAKRETLEKPLVVDLDTRQVVGALTGGGSSDLYFLPGGDSYAQRNDVSGKVTIGRFEPTPLP